jgi:hypothetical protein
MATGTKPTSALEKTKWANLKDEATRLIIELISTDLWFHVVTWKTPNEICTTLEGLFGKKDEMRGHILEV